MTPEYDNLMTLIRLMLMHESSEPVSASVSSHWHSGSQCPAPPAITPSADWPAAALQPAALPATGRQHPSKAGSEPAGMADSSSLEQLFIVEPDFCPSCGAILALPVRGQAIKCKVCNFSISVEVLLGHTTSSTYQFNSLGVYSSSKNLPEGGDEEQGQRDPHRECSKCGHMGMSYTTMQLRSADEGQTIFYMCPKCRHREVENS